MNVKYISFQRLGYLCEELKVSQCDWLQIFANECIVSFINKNLQLASITSEEWLEESKMLRLMLMKTGKYTL